MLLIGYPFPLPGEMVFGRWKKKMMMKPLLSFVLNYLYFVRSMYDLLAGLSFPLCMEDEKDTTLHHGCDQQSCHLLKSSFSSS